MPAEPPSLLAPLSLHLISDGLTLNYFRRAWYYQWVILSIILRVIITQKDVSFFHTLIYRLEEK